MFLKEQMEKEHKNASSEKFESSFLSFHSEHKLIQKKVEMIEDMLVKNRNDYFSQITELEKFFISKNENIKQAICYMCRTLKITNPLI